MKNEYTIKIKFQISNFTTHKTIFVNYICEKPIRRSVLTFTDYQNQPFDIVSISFLYKLLPKLVKISVAIFFKPLSNTINRNFSELLFLDYRKIVTVSQIQKRAQDKNKNSNFRPNSILDFLVYCVLISTPTI